MLGEVLGINPDSLFASISNENTKVEGSNMDPLLFASWQKLSQKQRNALIQIAHVLSQL
jgi:hypothetical protein